MGIFVEILPALIRYALAGAATALIQRGILTPDQFDRVVVGVALGVAVLASMIWAKVKDRIKVNTALAMPPGSTVDELKEKIASGVAAKATTPTSLPPRLPVVLLAVALSALVASCASLSTKQKISQSHQVAHQALVTVDEAERQLCQPAPAATNHCGNPVAASIGLTDAKHQDIARKLAKAFDDDAKAGVAIIAWRAGDPVPADLSALFRDAQDLAAVAGTITDNPLVTKAQTLIARLQAVIDAFGGGK